MKTKILNLKLYKRLETVYSDETELSNAVADLSQALTAPQNDIAEHQKSK